MRHPGKEGRVYLTWRNLPYVTHVRRLLFFFAFRARFIINGDYDGIANVMKQRMHVPISTTSIEINDEHK